ncbi:hypothetical protein PN480_12520 [Dolichospermum circinale CS-1225]|uniref:Uncharacterized protein n=1 Tax=Dolichospermum circinale CS-537/01 TaxID=3021739 RepID=A0ABT5A0J9_9CYAN|nr:hypothetical protein [Dolichospermum circinale]MDB9457041.1 hypothetical protein [Dolichospermum circinale CS-545/17]MDB9466983.1 hypothetical protein [Dolichospermum circinale CS-539/09]MDB9472302.1 hypothetical protein [Dolichospermum circinale CS-539]MDB9485455.1 hypothetical protein [Dolichospermum circinale CS-537/01]MDB9522766.1 hypothetical protein [Dolichospermum circinale CS-1225]
MSNNLLTKSITEEMQEEAEMQIREKKKSVDYNTIEYPIEVIVDKYLNAEVLNVKKSLIKIAQNMLNFGRRIKIF